jgi:hypothetical protein
MQFAGNRRQLAKIGKVVDENPPGTTLCANGRWSTNPPAPGVCSYNGGWIVNYPDLSRSLQAKAKKKPSALVLEDAPAADPAAVPPPAPVEAMGTWFETTYTTRKGKTGPALAIDFDQKPPREVLDILRDSRFWWSRQDLVWYGWDNEANREVIEAIPVVQEGTPITTVRRLDPVQQEPQKAEGYQVGDQVLVPYKNTLLPAVVKKKGTKYLTFDRGFLGKKTDDQVFPLNYRAADRLEIFRENLIKKMGDRYAWYYNSVVNPQGDTDAWLDPLFNTDPYRVTGSVRDANVALLQNDLRQNNYPSFKQWVIETLPKPAEMLADALPIMPKRGQRYSFEDYNRLKGRLWSVVRNEDTTTFPGIGEVIKQAQKLVQETFDKLGPIWFSYFVNGVNPYREKDRIYTTARDTGVMEGSPMGHLRWRWEMWVKDAFKGASEQTIDEFLRLKEIALSNMRSEFQQYAASYKPDFFTFNTNPLVFLEVVQDYSIRNWLFPKLYDVPAIHDPFRARSMGYEKSLSLDIGGITQKEYLDFNFYEAQAEFKDKGGQKMRTQGFFALLPSLIFNRSFDWQACINADFDVNQCSKQDLPGWEQLNGRRWKYILYIEESIRRRLPVSDQAFKDYEELLNLAGTIKPEGWQFNLTERPENTDSSDGINLILKSLGITDLRAQKARGSGFLWMVAPESGSTYQTQEAHARQILAERGIPHFDALVQAGKAIMRNWGKSTIFDRVRTGPLSYRVGDQAKVYYGGKYERVIITNITPPRKNSNDNFENVFYFNFEGVKNPNKKCCNDVTINRVYPIDYPEKTSSIGQVFQARQRFRTLRVLNL